MEIGKTLKDARDLMGISLETAEENTKIRRKYLEALEQENYGIIPGRVYIKAFLKNYAVFLGLNADDLISEFEDGVLSADKEDEGENEKLTHIEKTRKPGYLKIALGLALLVAVIYLLVPALAGTNKGKVPSPPAGQEMKNLTQNEPAGNKGQDKVAQEVKPTEQKGVSLSLNVTADTSWMYVEIDGKPTFTGFLGSGQMKEFKGAEKIYLRLGNAGVVEVEYNGQKMGVLGGRGEVVNREFIAPQV